LDYPISCMRDAAQLGKLIYMRKRTQFIRTTFFTLCEIKRLDAGEFSGPDSSKAALHSPPDRATISTTTALITKHSGTTNLAHFNTVLE